MAIRDLVPRNREEQRFPAIGRDWAGGPLSTLHRELDRLFEDFGGADMAAFGAGGRWPCLEVNEDDEAVRVTAELPGLAEKDIDLKVDNGVLTISGERRQEKDDKERGYSERYYGRFERRLALPRGIKEDEARAQFGDGVLTVMVPKGPEADRGRKIPISAEHAASTTGPNG
jgi:HSP20 family protein